MATKAKAPLDESGVPMRVTKLVAGAGSVLCDLFNAQGLDAGISVKLPVRDE
jgi:hypothetical protein